MSHACVIVALDGNVATARESIENAVAEAMAPYEEGSWFEEGSRWDWWRIGGRYTGHLDGYEPQDDPQNIETCSLCLGTGKRRDMECANGCNGCQGSGRRVKWPTQWAKHDGDIARKGAARRDLSAYAFLREGQWHERDRMGWFGGSVPTECEADGETPNVCRYEKKGSVIVSWGDRKDWSERYYERFIKPLPDDTILVVVDYHV